MDGQKSTLRALCEPGIESTLGFAPWTVILRAEGRVIGWGGLSIDPFVPGLGVEVSYYFDSRDWGRGYATELVTVSIHYGFDTVRLPAIQAFARPENVVSVRVLEKCGLTFLRYEPELERNHYEIRCSSWTQSCRDSGAGT